VYCEQLPLAGNLE
jgi:hypothetical protein